MPRPDCLRGRLHTSNSAVSGPNSPCPNFEKTVAIATAAHTRSPKHPTGACDPIESETEQSGTVTGHAGSDIKGHYLPTLVCTLYTCSFYIAVLYIFLWRDSGIIHKRYIVEKPVVPAFIDCPGSSGLQFLGHNGRPRPYS